MSKRGIEVITEEEYVIPRVPEKGMLMGIVKRAISDVNRDNLLYQGADIGAKQTEDYYCRLAEIWFLSKDKQPWSFLWVCEELDINPKDVLKLLKL